MSKNTITVHYRPTKGDMDLIKFFREQRGLEAATEAHIFNIMKYALRLARKEGVEPIKDVIKILDYANRLKEFYEEDIKEFEDQLNEQFSLGFPPELETQLQKDENFFGTMDAATFVNGGELGANDGNVTRLDVSGSLNVESDFVEVRDVKSNQVYATIANTASSSEEPSNITAEAIAEVEEPTLDELTGAILSNKTRLTPLQAYNHLKDMKSVTVVKTAFINGIYDMVSVPKSAVTVSGTRCTAGLSITYLGEDGVPVVSSQLGSVLKLMKLTELMQKVVVDPETKEPVKLITPHATLGQRVADIISDHLNANEVIREELGFPENLEISVTTEEGPKSLDMQVEISLESLEQANYIRGVFIEELARKEMEKSRSK